MDSLVSVALSRDSFKVFPIQFDTISRKSNKKTRFESISVKTASISSHKPSGKIFHIFSEKSLNLPNLEHRDKSLSSRDNGRYFYS